MKYVKTLGLAIGVVAAFMAFVGAGSASATVLCKTNSTPCAAGQMVEKGAEIKARLVAGTEANLHAGFAEVKCKESTVVGKISTTGSATETVEGPLGTLTFGNCTGRVKVLNPGNLIIHWISGTMNGTVTSLGAEVEVEQIGVTCVYGSPTATDIGTLTGGNPAVLDASAELTKVTGGFLCANPANWEAKYEVTSPKPLWVAES